MNLTEFNLFVGIIAILLAIIIIELLIIFWLVANKLKKDTDEEIEKIIEEA